MIRWFSRWKERKYAERLHTHIEMRRRELRVMLERGDIEPATYLDEMYKLDNALIKGILR